MLGRRDGLGFRGHGVGASEALFGGKIGRGDVRRNRLGLIDLAVQGHDLGCGFVLQRRNLKLGAAGRVHVVGLEHGGRGHGHGRHDGGKSEKTALVFDARNPPAVLFVFSCKIQIVERGLRGRGRRTRRVGSEEFLKLVKHAGK